MVSGFKYRILIVDDDEAFLMETASLLSQEGYVVLTARDGFGALADLQGSVPEIVISDLEMPRMSGFEFLAVVRNRFPAVGVIARDDEFYPAGMPEGVLADRFVRKGENSAFELLETVRELLQQLPLRTAHVRPELAAAWIPRTATGYIVITCPSCLRSSSLKTRDVKTGVATTSSCIHCGREIKYCLDSTTVNDRDQPTIAERARARANSSHRAVVDSQIALTESNARIARTKTRE